MREQRGRIWQECTAHGRTCGHEVDLAGALPPRFYLSSFSRRPGAQNVHTKHGSDAANGYMTQCFVSSPPQTPSGNAAQVRLRPTAPNAEAGICLERGFPRPKRKTSCDTPKLEGPRPHFPGDVSRTAVWSSPSSSPSSPSPSPSSSPPPSRPLPRASSPPSLSIRLPRAESAELPLGLPRTRSGLKRASPRLRPGRTAT